MYRPRFAILAVSLLTALGACDEGASSSPDDNVPGDDDVDSARCGGEPDLPDFLEIQCGDSVIPVLAAFRAENGDDVRFATPPGASADCPFLIQGGAVRGSEVASCAPFTATAEDASTAGNYDVGRDRVEVTWCWYTDVAEEDGTCCVQPAADAAIACRTAPLDLRFACDGGSGVASGADQPLALKAAPTCTCLDAEGCGVPNAVALAAESAEHFYVDGVNGDDTRTGYSGSPLRTINRALSKSGPGDTIHVLPTTTYWEYVWINKGGTASSPITFVGGNSTTARTRIRYSKEPFHFSANAEHIVVKQFDVSGSSAGNGIYMAPGSHHITVTGNYVFDSGKGGIASNGTDYATITRNIVAYNAKNVSTFCGSGISLYSLKNSDGYTGVKNVISGNLVYGNTNEYGSGCAHSDGNGIIIDDSRNTQNKTYVKYNGTTLIENNIIFENGGRGVHVYLSDNVTIRNNSTYNNNRDRLRASWRPGEIMAVSSGNVRIHNNIGFTDGYVSSSNSGAATGISLQSCNGAAIHVTDNLLYNSSAPSSTVPDIYERSSAVPVYRARNVAKNPGYYAKDAAPSANNFRLFSWSPALYSGQSSTAATVDYRNASRTTSTASRGAYQHAD